MRPQKQLNRHDPDKGVWGDCERAAWATILDLDLADVPHFWDGGVDTATAVARQREFEKTLGLYYVSVPFTSPDGLGAVLNCVSHNNPDAEYLLCGTSRTGCNHTVVCKGDKIVWDPALNDSGIVGAADDGFFWVTIFGKRPK